MKHVCHAAWAALGVTPLARIRGFGDAEQEPEEGPEEGPEKEPKVLTALKVRAISECLLLTNLNEPLISNPLTSPN